MAKSRLSEPPQSLQPQCLANIEVLHLDLGFRLENIIFLLRVGFEPFHRLRQLSIVFKTFSEYAEAISKRMIRNGGVPESGFIINGEIIDWIDCELGIPSRSTRVCTYPHDMDRYAHYAFLGHEMGETAERIWLINPDVKGERWDTQRRRWLEGLVRDHAVRCRQRIPIAPEHQAPRKDHRTYHLPTVGNRYLAT